MRFAKAKAIVLHILPGLHATKLRQRKLHLALPNVKFTLTGTPNFPSHFPFHFPSNANFHFCAAALLCCYFAALLLCCAAAFLRCCFAALLLCNAAAFTSFSSAVRKNKARRGPSGYMKATGRGSIVLYILPVHPNGQLSHFELDIRFRTSVSVCGTLR